MPKPMSALVEDLKRSLGEATDHERCPDGSHWNENDRKCMKLPKDLHALVKNAHKASADAGAAKDTKEKLRTHHSAQAHHDVARVALKNRGFHELSKAHASKVDSHNAAADAATADLDKERGK